MDRKKEGLWVNYSLSDGGQSPYAASLLGNLMHWLADDPGVRDLIRKERRPSGEMTSATRLADPVYCHIDIYRKKQTAE